MAKVTPERMFEVLGEKPEEFDKAVNRLYKRGNRYEIPAPTRADPNHTRPVNRHQAEHELERILAAQAPAGAEDGMTDEQRRVCLAALPGYTERAGNREFRGYGLLLGAMALTAFLWMKGCMPSLPNTRDYNAPRPGTHQPVRPGTYQPVGPGNYGDRSQSPTPSERRERAKDGTSGIALGLLGAGILAYLAGRKRED